MRYLKLYENFGEYYESIEGTDFHYLCEINDHIRISDKVFKLIRSKISKKYKMVRHFNGIEISGDDYYDEWKIYQGDDDYFFISKKVQDIMSGPYNDYYNYYRCDQIEGLLKYLSDYLDKSLNESLDDDQIEELSDLFVEVSDEFGLNEAIPNGTLHPPGQRPGDNGAWRLSRLSGVYTELFVQINVEQVDIMKFENSLEEFLRKAEKLGHRIERLWWRDRYKYDNMYRASRYMIKIW